MFESEFVNGGIRKEETYLFAFDDKSTTEREMFVSEFANYAYKEERNLFIFFLQVNQRRGVGEGGRERMFVSEFVNGGLRKEETCLFLHPVNQNVNYTV